MRKKILVVEDNTELLDLLRLHLKAAGFAIATATNGIEALRKARSVSPDLVLLDLGLPELDGLAVYETLRNTPASAAVPIIIVTGLPDGLARCAGLTASHCEFVSKPVNPKCLIARIKELLRPVRGSSGAPRGERPKLPVAAARTAVRAGDRGSGLEGGSRFQHGQGSAAKRH
jgi:DNA-binding response OmpR family regulator